MNTSVTEVVTIYSDQYEELHDLFKQLKVPYREEDVRTFSAAYKRNYPYLSQVERKRVEWLVDLMIERLERKELASLIFGVF